MLTSCLCLQAVTHCCNSLQSKALEKGTFQLKLCWKHLSSTRGSRSVVLPQFNLPHATGSKFSSQFP